MSQIQSRTLSTGGTTPREDRRTSPNRERKFQRDSRRRTGCWDLTLSIEDDFPTAVCEYDDGSYNIKISGREFKQIITNYDPIAWDLLVQKVLTIHENAHALYTDFEDLDDRISQRDSKYKQVYHSLHNVLEDGRIEVLIVSKYPIYEKKIEHFRENFMRTNSAWEQWDTEDTQNRTLPDDDQCTAPKDDGSRCQRGRHNGTDTCWQHDDEDAQAWDKDGGQTAAETRTVSVYDAVELGLLDKGTQDVGRYDALLDPDNDTYEFSSSDDRQLFVDEIDPLIHEVIDDVQNESDAQAANKRIMAFIDEIIEHIEVADDGGMENAGDRDGNAPHRPNDAETQGGPAAAEVVPDMDTDDDEDGSDNGDSDDDEGDTDDSDAGTADEIEDELEDELENEQVPVSGSGSSDDDGGDPIQKIDTEDEDTNLDQESVEDVTQYSTPQHRNLIDPAKEKARHIRSVLTLEPDSDGKIERNKAQGRFDSTAAVRAHVGDTRRYKARQTKPDTPEFNLMFVLDRSNSMYSQERKTAISAVLQSVYALNTYRNVNVGVYELYDDRVRRAMPLGADVEEYEGAIAHGYKAGGTPLTDALALTRKRMELETGANIKNRLFVVTDGKPDNHSEYKDELENTTIPVVGLSIHDNPDQTAGDEYYHRHKTVPENGTGLTEHLKGLLSELTED